MSPMLQNLSRLDSNETIFFTRQLEAIDPTAYMTLFAGILGRRYIPLVENVSPLENVYTYRMYTIHGKARLGAPRARNAPVVSVTAEEASQNIKQIPVAMTWTVREIQQAAKYNVPLDNLTVQAAMSTIARKQDNMLAFGEAGTNIKGLLNHSSVVLSTPVNKTGGGTAWTGATVKADEIIKDVNTLINDTRAALKQASKMPGGDATPAFDKFTVLVPSTRYSLIASTPRTDNSDTTILQFLLRNNPFIESIEEWFQCDTADAAGTGPRLVAYPRDPMCVGALIPEEFNQLGPQEEGHSIVVPANGSCGGTVLRYTVAVRYMDGI